jgi:hypothetical protein
VKNKYKIKKYNNKKCIVCLSTFETTHPAHKFCTTKCRETNIEKNKIKTKQGSYFIFSRDNFTCSYCGKNTIDDNIKLTIDHVFPLNKGGTNEIYNLTTSCSSCNSSKYNNLLPKSILYKIWNKNNNNTSHKEETLTEMVKDFNKIYKSRLKP